jgi:hemerythrin-like domain-containing protein
MKVSEVLRKEHHHILRALDVLEAMAIRASHGEAVNKNDAKDIVAVLDSFADKHHQAKEEAVLFPALLRDRHQKHHDQLCALAFEHDQERSLACGLQEAVETNNPKEFLFCANELIAKTRAHVEMEDRILLTLADGVLSPMEQERTAAELSNFDTSFQRQTLSGLLNKLDQMQARYCLARTRTAG